MKYLYFFLFVFSLTAYSQDSTKVREITRKYVDIKFYRNSGKELTKKDSLNFRFHNGDTLVLVGSEFFNEREKNKIRVEYEPKDDDFLRIYKQAVFGVPEDGRKEETIKIWKDDIKLFFDPSVPKAHHRELLLFAEKVSSNIDSLQIREVQNRADSNFLVFYRQDESEFDQEPRISNERKASYHLSWNGKQQLYRGVIKVNAYQIPRPEDQLELLKYYFFKSLGYFSYSPEIPCESYLSSCPEKRELTREDLEILKYHYSYGMCKGINRENFEKIHRDYKEILKKHPNSRLYLVQEI